MQAMQNPFGISYVKGSIPKRAAVSGVLFVREDIYQELLIKEPVENFWEPWKAGPDLRAI